MAAGSVTTWRALPAVGHTAPVRTAPREERDLFIAAGNGYLLAFDNLSDITACVSDALCRLASGGSFAVRQLYTDRDEVLFQAARPIILNGIEDFITRPDLADHAIFLTLPHLQEKRRRAENEIWRDFASAGPHILGALLEAASHGLRALPEVRLEQLPRMADFALWATACEAAFCPAGGFLHAYKANPGPPSRTWSRPTRSRLGSETSWPSGPCGAGMPQSYCASLPILPEMARPGRV